MSSGLRITAILLLLLLGGVARAEGDEYDGLTDEQKLLKKNDGNVRFEVGKPGAETPSDGKTVNLTVTDQNRKELFDYIQRNAGPAGAERTRRELEEAQKKAAAAAAAARLPDGEGTSYGQANTNPNTAGNPAQQGGVLPSAITPTTEILPPIDLLADRDKKERDEAEREAQQQARGARTSNGGRGAGPTEFISSEAKEAVSDNLGKKFNEEYTKTTEFHPVAGGGQTPTVAEPQPSVESQIAGLPEGAKATAAGAPKNDGNPETQGRLKAESLAERVLAEMGGETPAEGGAPQAKAADAVKSLLKYFDPSKDGQAGGPLPLVEVPPPPAVISTGGADGGPAAVLGIDPSALLAAPNAADGAAGKSGGIGAGGVGAGLGRVVILNANANGAGGGAIGNLSGGGALLGSLAGLKQTAGDATRKVGRLLRELIALLSGRRTASSEKKLASARKKAGDQFKAPSKIAALVMMRETPAAEDNGSTEEDDDEDLAGAMWWLGLAGGTVLTLSLVGLLTWVRRTLRDRSTRRLAGRSERVPPREDKNVVAA